MPKGGRNLEKVLVVINYCSYVEFLEVAYITEVVSYYCMKEKITLRHIIRLDFSDNRAVSLFSTPCM